MIAGNFKILEDKILAACKSAGRNRSEIILIGVSKNNTISAIKEALNIGIRDFGENKAQELRDKCLLFEGDFNWHFVGHLQTNKVKYVIEPAEYIHSVDSSKLADEINFRAGKFNKRQKILFEVNTSEEDSKYGLTKEDEVFKLADYCSGKENLEICGLMTMAPYTDDEVVIKKSFEKLNSLKGKLVTRGFNLRHLSMGMTNDFELAIREGATMIRIGTALFGHRDYNKSWKEE
ncbi:MAG: YggS family pyridoxal phosphate-dependent enzyme [Bacteroidota bacterium]|nr:YggS family pyridoxal phosphate-dependent enzyme [Bacteroidota bacterium]